MKIPKFKNETFVDFSIKSNRNLMEKALLKVKKENKKEYGLLIDGKSLKTTNKIVSHNPSTDKEVVGIVQSASIKEAELAMKSAVKAFETWKYTIPEERAEYLLKTAKIMKKRKYEISATMVLEVGKNWLEAIADTAESIDFLEFYAREMIRLGKFVNNDSVTGEENTQSYVPLGVGIIIAPWNFPNAIFTGMTAAAIVAGNTVVVKPSSLSVITAAKVVEMFQEAGLPNGVLNFITGEGGKIGDYLVEHPQTRFVNFTGSRDVGLSIAEKASKIQNGQKWIKRVAAEMGGKNAIIVDESADINTAVKSTILSAFGFQGQKCSAASRVIVDKKIYNHFVKALLEEVKEISIGPVTDYAHFLGPVVDENAQNKILNYIEIGKKEGKLIHGGVKLPLPGNFILPTIFTDIQPTDRLAREEIFGPVLSIIQSGSFDESLKIGNSTEYGLTGGVITKDKDKIEKAKRFFEVGNLYINRKITGALVDVQPFGGYNMSGTCAKAGGKDYLLLFMQGKAISQKL